MKTIIGTSGTDHLTHSDSIRVEMFGHGGNDILTLEHGNGGLLHGDRGMDILDGGPGYDVLWGGKGRDKFVFNDAITSRNVDALADFQPGRDKIVLDVDIFEDIRNPDGWFGTVIEQNGHALTYNGHTIAFIRGGVQIDEGDFLFV